MKLNLYPPAPPFGAKPTCPPQSWRRSCYRGPPCPPCLVQ